MCSVNLSCCNRLSLPAEVAVIVLSYVQHLVTHQDTLPCHAQPCAGGNSGLLFDWALPLLGKAGGDGGPDWSSQYWVLMALQECMVCLDDSTRSRYAPNVLQASQTLLEREDTSVHLLIPILGVLLQARHLRSNCMHAFRP